MPNKFTRKLTITIITLLLAGGSLLLSIGINYIAAQKVLGILSSDGVFDALTPQRFIVLQYPIIIIAGLLLCSGIFFSLKVSVLHTLLKRIMAVFKGFPEDFNCIRTSVRNQLPQVTWEWVLFTVILLTGIFARGLLLNNSLAYDESYTYISFVKPGLDTILLDYHVPNNHVFHSVLCWFSTILLSPSPITIRLVAFLAGIGSIPLAFLLGSSSSNKSTGFVSAALISVWPWLVYYGKNARGYTLLITFALLLYLALSYLKTNRNDLLWFFLPIIIALGGWTMPTMLYPTAGIFIWFFLSIIIEKKPDTYDSRWQAVLYLVLSGVLSILFLVILYSPIVIWGTGLNSLISNHFLRHYSLSVLPSEFVNLFHNTWKIAFRRIEFLQMPIIFGWVLHLLTFWRKEKRIIPQSLTTLLAICALILLQRVVPYERTWTFLLPFLIIWSVQGWIEAVQFIQEKFFPQKKSLVQWLNILCLIPLLFGIKRMLVVYPDQLQQIKDIPNTAQFLKQISDENSWIVADAPEDMPYYFYHQYYQLDPTLLEYKETIETIYVIDSLHDDNYVLEDEVIRILNDHNYTISPAELENIKVIQTFIENGEFYSLGTVYIIEVPILED